MQECQIGMCKLTKAIQTCSIESYVLPLYILLVSISLLFYFVSVTISNIVLLDGGYGEWSKWSECSRSCGRGENLRTRLCNNPTPSGGGKNCSQLGSAKESQPCNDKECPVGKVFVIKN